MLFANLDCKTLRHLNLLAKLFTLVPYSFAASHGFNSASIRYTSLAAFVHVEIVSMARLLPAIDDYE